MSHDSEADVSADACGGYCELCKTIVVASATDVREAFPIVDGAMRILCEACCEFVREQRALPWPEIACRWRAQIMGTLEIDDAELDRKLNAYEERRKRIDSKGVQ